MGTVERKPAVTLTNPANPSTPPTSTTTDSPSSSSFALDRFARPRMLIAIALVWLGLIRCVAMQEPFPYWAMDPLVVWSPPAGLTPFTSGMLDLLILVLASLAFVIESLSGRRLMPWTIVLALIGSLPALWHGAGAGDASDGAWLEHTRIGLGWASAAIAGVATLHLAREPRIRTSVIAICLGLVGMLLAKGMVQYWIEHAQSVQQFKENKASLLAAQGWLAGSEQARMFERRLLQREATGWFGLSNVYASLMAATTGAMIPLAWLALRSMHSRPLNSKRADAAQPVSDRVSGFHAAGLVLGAVAGVIGVGLAGSKSGYALVALGLAIASVITLASRAIGALPRLARRGLRLAGLATPLAVVALVALNGLLGNPLHQLSLLFRWFYLQGATRVFGEHAWWGTGPAGFKDSWMLAKPSASPENIESPHSIAMDWLACLGVSGTAWLVLAIWMGLRLGRVLAPNPRPASTENFQPTPSLAEIDADRYLERLQALCIAACTLVGGLAELTILLPESIALHVLGLLAWIWIAKSIARVLASHASQHTLAMPAMAIAGVLVLTHSQIEMTMVRPGAMHWAWLLLAAISAPGLATTTQFTQGARPRNSPRLAASLALAGIPGAIAVILAITFLRPVQRWEQSLGLAARALQPPASLAKVGPDWAPDAPAFAKAVEHLQHAAEAAPGHLPTLESLARLSFASLYAGLNTQTMPAIADAASAEGVRRSPMSALAWNQRALVLAQLGELRRDTGLKLQAKEALLRAATFDPHGWKFQATLATLCASLGLPDEAQSWAKRAMQASDRLTLDPEAQMPGDQRKVLDRLTQGSQ